MIATDKGTIKLDDKTIKSIASVGSDVSITIAQKTAGSEINGKGGGKFDPNGQVSRAEFVQILAKLSGEDLNKYATSKFGDVTVDSWYAGAVAWAAANGIVSGIAKDEFAPNAAISRQDMAVIIERYLKN